MFPELRRKESDIKEVLDEEEESFARTLDRGEKMFSHYAEQTKLRETDTLNGADVWRLYDTFGFPVDLTRIMAVENSLRINENEFEEAQTASKEASKAKKKGSGGELLKLDVHDLGKLETMTNVPKTDDSYKYGESVNICMQLLLSYGSNRAGKHHFSDLCHLSWQRILYIHKTSSAKCPNRYNS